MKKKIIKKLMLIYSNDFDLSFSGYLSVRNRLEGLTLEDLQDELKKAYN